MARGTTKDLQWTLRDVRVLSIAQTLQDHYRGEEGMEVPFEVVVAALEDWLDLHLDQMADDLPEMLSTPSRTEAAEFRRFVGMAMRRVKAADAELLPQEAEASVFTGHRVFSFEKLAAMTAYIAHRGRDVYKTKLNKLLFYSDFVNYHLQGTSISGAKYVHLPYGPVPDRYESILKKLELTGTLNIIEGPGHQRITAADDPLTDTLSPSERSSIDWVLTNLGTMSAAEISEYSHREKAYRNTRTGEYIAYEYAKFFQRIPTHISGGPINQPTDPIPS